MEADYIISDKILSGKEGMYWIPGPKPSLQLLACLDEKSNRLRQENDSSRVAKSLGRPKQHRAGWQGEREGDQSNLRSVPRSSWCSFLASAMLRTMTGLTHVVEEKSPETQRSACVSLGANIEFGS